MYRKHSLNEIIHIADDVSSYGGGDEKVRSYKGLKQTWKRKEKTNGRSKKENNSS